MDLIEASLKQLKSVGLDLSSTAKLPDGTTIKAAHEVQVRGGIIFVGPKNNKGKVLGSYLATQQKPTKLAVTVRYNPEVIAYFKAIGDGWQTLMNDAMRVWVSE